MYDKDREIIICRCEDLTLADIKELITKGYRSLDELRRISRCGPTWNEFPVGWPRREYLPRATLRLWSQSPR